MTGVQFYPLDLSMRLLGSRPYITLYGRTASGERIAVTDSTYLPYLYVLPKDENLEKELNGFTVKVENDYYSIVKIEKKSMRLNEKEVSVLKCSLNSHFAYHYIYDALIRNPKVSAVYEHDVGFINSYLMDKKIIPGFLANVEGEITNPHIPVAVMRADSIVQEDDVMFKNPKILAFNIETYSPKGKPASPSSDPVVMVSFYSENFQKTITWRKFDTNDKTIEFVNTETELILRFKRIIEEFQPDFLTGYASDIFAFPYLKKRCMLHNIKLDIGIDKSLADISSETSIKGIIHADVYKFVYKMFGSKLATDNFRLAEVAMELLGEGRKKTGSLTDAWDSKSDLTSFCSYSLNDASLIYRLFLKILPSVFEYAKLTNLGLFDVLRGSLSQFSEAFLMKESRNSNELIPPRPSRRQYDERETRNIKGISFETAPGVYNNIVVYDFQSLYPSIISVHNISLGALRCRCCNEIVPDEEMHFCRKINGFFPKIMGALSDRRQRILKLLGNASEKTFEQVKLLNARQDAVKSLMNSLYGYFGYASSRWYNFECAKAVSAYGRYYVNNVILKAKEAGFEVVHADNDSVFLKLGGKRKEDAEKFFLDVNDSLPEKMQLEYSGFYPRSVFIPAKTGKTSKKYAMLSEKGFLKITGLEASRRNFSTIAKEVQENVLHYILKERKLRQAMEYVKKVISDVREGKVALDKMIIYTHLQKELSRYETIAPHVAVAKKMQQRGFNVVPGSIIRYVVAKGSGSIAELAQFPNEVSSYNADYYIENQIIPAVERIFVAAGVDFHKALAEKEQSSLGEFI